MSYTHEFQRDNFNYSSSLSEIVNRYVSWVSEDMYLILSKLNEVKVKYEWFAVKCAKRGNDIYKSRVYNRFKDLCSMADNLTFFNPKDRSEKKTRALWVTLTYDSKRCLFEDAWIKIGVELNRFLSSIRKKFGKLSCCRVFESFENGYPHIHCILLFENKWFKVFRDRKAQFRIYEKKSFEDGWHSNIDVKAMSSLAGGFSYLKKYLLKGIDYERADSKALKTLALCWHFRKRAFSVNGSFRKLLINLINGLKKRFHQVTLLGEVVPEKYEFVGFISSEIISLKRNVWFVKLDSGQTAKVEEYLENHQLSHYPQGFVF